MIEWMVGRVVRRVSGTNRVIVDVNGVGYGVEVATSRPDLLPAVGERLELHISTVMSDSSIRLFGFPDSAGKDMFEVITGVSGVGPKLGLALMSSLGSSGLAAAVLGNDLRSLKAVPGVGAKTAERLILELRDRVTAFAGASGGDSTPNTSGGLAGPGPSNREADVVHALVSMGVKPAIAERAALKAREALGPDGEFQELMREALRHRQ